MKKAVYFLIIALTLVSLICMFLPIATFQDNSANSMAEDIAKAQDKVDRAQEKLDRWVAEGKKSAEEIEKQRGQVAKEQAKLDALL